MTAGDLDRDPATLFFRNRHLLWLTVVVVLVGGFSATLSLPRLEDPRITNRGPLVITPVPGASAERVEALVTEVLEKALDEIDAIKDLDSTSRAGVSVISIELSPAVTAADNGELFAEIRDKIGEARALLPPDAGDPVVDDKRDPAAFTLIIGVSWDAPIAPQVGMLNRIAEDLADAIRNVDGTELVRIYGEPEEEILVELDRDELSELSLSATGIGELIGAADSKRPAGVLRGDRSDLLIEVEGELESVERIRQIPVATGRTGSVLSLGNIASVRRSWREPEDEIGLLDGRRTVMVAARVASDTRTDEWAAKADGVLASFETHRAPGIRLDRIFEQEKYTSERLGVLASNLLAGAGVILVAVFVIMGLRPAIVVCAALPMVVAMVLIGWQVSGSAIHQMSIFGLIIALGLLIDNAIVMTDEVASLKSQGRSPVDAVRGAVRHLFLPLLASTITTMLAFAPIMLLPGSAGDFVGSIGTSVVLAIGASFVIAMTVTASLAGIFATPAATGSKRRWYRDGLGPTWLTRGYRATLNRLYGSPLAAIAIAAALPLAGLVVAPRLGNQFFPPVDRNMFEIRVWLPSDSSVTATRAEAEAIERTLRTLDGVEHVSWLIGSSHPSVYYNLIMNQDRSARYAHAVVTTDSSESTKRLLDEAQLTLDNGHPGARVLARQFAQGPPVVADIEYRIFGPSDSVLQDLGDRYRAALQSHPDVLHTESTLERGEPKIFFDADEDEARLAGLTLSDIASQLESSLEGSALGSVIEDLEQLPVRVRVSERTRSDLDAIASSSFVRPGSDRWVHAESLGVFRVRPETGGVTRFNSQRTNTVKAYVRNGALPIDISQGILARLDADGFELPPGYRIELGGASEQDAEANENLAAYAPILATLMVATLILAFRSVRYAAMLGTVAMFSVGLALISTWSVGLPISFNTILGTLGLIGVALNDSIVVLAALRSLSPAQRRDPGAVAERVIGATRHIVATTATTIGGFLPLLLFVGGDFWPSLAIVLVGGITGASLVALLFIPGVFMLAERRPRSASKARREPGQLAMPTTA